MPPRLNLPANVSYVEEKGDGRLFASAAERNVAPIAEIVGKVAPMHGHALEIASGTGQHVVTFALLREGLVWQPTDVDADRLISIDGWVADAGLKNVRPARLLDATIPGWSDQANNYSLVVIVNLLHLISENEAWTVLSEAAQSLAPGGKLILYGPFFRDNRATSQGDWTFDASLRSSDPEIGYKDDGAIINWLNECGLLVETPIGMPANNLTFIATRPGALPEADAEMAG